MKDREMVEVLLKSMSFPHRNVMNGRDWFGMDKLETFVMKTPIVAGHNKTARLTASKLKDRYIRWMRWEYQETS